MVGEIKVNNDVCIYDIETKTFGAPDPNKDRMRVFGCHSYKTKKAYLLTNKADIQKFTNAHKFLVGFNNEGYDNPILKREGIDLNYKIMIDLMDIFKRRAGAMKVKKGMLKDILMSYSLDYITRTLDLVDDETAKDKIDYALFRKDNWTPEEAEQIKKYTLRDIEITKKLYEWVEDYFAGFKEFVSDEDARKKKYLTVSIAKFSYKAICKALKWNEQYAQWGDDVDDSESIAGGYVAYPAGGEFHSDENGDLYALDFASLYPHIMIMCNLFGRKREGEYNDRPTWNGGGVWEVEGQYYTDEMSGVSLLLKQWYYSRMFYKRKFLCADDNIVYSMKDIKKFLNKKIYVVEHGVVNTVLVDEKLISEYENFYSNGVDRREYTLKIIMNTIYGILNTMYYTLVYDKTAGGDCTRLGRQFTRYARKVFREHGYKVIYTDTDSVYILDPFKDKERMLKVREKIMKHILDSVPFPQPTFDLAVENEIKHMFFFKGGGSDKEEEMDEDDFINKPLGFMKKNYILVTKEGKVIIKNLGIRKKSNSELSKKIFWEYMVPKIKEGQIKFSKTYIKNLINELLEKDIKLAALRKDVKSSEFYVKSPTSLPAQISAKYGSGIHFLIPNVKNIGVGKGKSYATIAEFKKNNLRLEHIDLSGVFNELDYFTKAPVTKNIFSFEEK